MRLAGRSADLSRKQPFFAAKRLTSATGQGSRKSLFLIPTSISNGATPMSPLSPAYFAFAAIAIALYWACYRWKLARLSILLLANVFFLARLAWFYPAILLAAATVDFLVGLGLQNLPRERSTSRLALVSLSVLLNVGLLA